MGSSSKVILVGATSLIVGVYAISLKKAEVDGVQAAMKNVKRVQNERIEDAAMRTSLSSFVKDNGKLNKKGTQKALDGSTFSYNISKIKHTDNYLLTLTIARDGVEKTITGQLSEATGDVSQGARKIHRGKWQVTKSFTSR
jgi:hypothetical protein